MQRLLATMQKVQKTVEFQLSQFVKEIVDAVKTAESPQFQIVMKTGESVDVVHTFHGEPDTWSQDAEAENTLEDSAAKSGEWCPDGWVDVKRKWTRVRQCK